MENPNSVKKRKDEDRKESWKIQDSLLPKWFRVSLVTTTH
jgi:hypothetical protein